MNYTYRPYEETLMQGHPVISSITDGEGEVFTVGRDNVKEIRQHYSQGEGDRWFYDVEYTDGRYLRLFDFKWVLFSHPTVEGAENE